MEFNRQLRRTLPCNTRAPFFARRSLDLLEGAMDEETFNSLRLLVVELVTNSVRHSGTSPDGTIDMSVQIEAEKIRAEVTDRGAPFDPPVRSHDPLDPSGRGLLLVDLLSDRWGPGGGDKNTVWFELDSGG